MKAQLAHWPRAVLVLAATVALTLTAAASAGKVSRETIHEEDTVVLEDFCEVEGLTVELSFVLDLRVKSAPRGRDRLVYFQSHGRRTEVITNVANDRFVTTASKVLEKDLKVTNNGDGTLTILILATGNAAVYGPNGKAIGRNPGQVRFELVVDHGGTPQDPDDDEELSFRIVRESTGRTDDFCGAVVPALS
jgi:hypothetical protein